MAKRYDKLSENLIEFIRHQKIFFVGTASDKGTINVSPKGYDSLRVIDSNHIVWLNITGQYGQVAGSERCWEYGRVLAREKSD